MRRADAGSTAGAGTPAGRPAGSAAFRADPAVAASTRPSRRQTTALVAALVLVCAAIGTASYVVRPDTARSFDLVHGSIFLTDQVAPVGIDLASGRPTLRLVGADKQVGATRPTDLALVPVQGGTLMVDRQTGQFNMVDDTGFVIKHDGGGVLLPRRADRTTSAAVAARGGAEADVAGAAYIVRSGPRGTNVLLVNQSNVDEASRGVDVVHPRASLTTTAQAAPGSDAISGANGDLWALFGTGDTHEIRQLSVPARSGTGASLASRLRGTVNGPAAIASASTYDDGSGSTAVAVASAGRITYFPADGGSQRVIAVPEQAGVDAVVPVSSAQRWLAFLMHGSGGWTLVTLNADGTDRQGPTPVSGIPASADLARPSWSSGSLYTVDRSNGGIYRIGPDGAATTVAGARSYPVAAAANGRAAEAASFGDAYVVARGSRVIINSPSHTQAVALFTDGRRRPLIIRKSSAVDVSAAGGAEALTRRNLDPSDERGNTHRGTQTKPTAGTQINNQVDCANTTQKPHVPQLGVPTPGSRSIGLTWTYPTLDPQDCVPVSYKIIARALSADAPSSGGFADVNGQTSANVTGLYPQTEYAVTVRAYLGNQYTPSRTIRVTTGKEGPAAPTDVQARPDSSGNWILTWNGCGGVGQGCVPVQSWRIVPSICDGAGLSATPTPLDVTADPSARAQPQTVYRGGAGLLGRGLRFQVVGTGTQDEPGTLSQPSGCTYSWRAPDAGAVSVVASTPPGTIAADGSTTVTATMRFANSQTVDLGGVGGQLTYKLLSGGAVVASVGPTQDPSVSLSGVRAGQRYTVQVTASPPKHPEVVVPVGTADVQPATAAWPSVGVTAGFATTSATGGTLTVRFDLGGAPVRGETFDVDGSLTCASTQLSLDRSNVAVGDTLSYDVDRLEYNGDCKVAVQLAQNSATQTDPPLFGAALSGVAGTDVSIDRPSSTTTASDFSATWGSDPDNPQVTVTYSGGDNESLMTGWTLRVDDGDAADACGTSTDSPPATIDVKASCLTNGSTLSVVVDYTYFASTPHYVIPISGTTPKPIQVTQDDFSVAWGGDATAPTADVTYHGSESDTRLGKAAWTETVTSSTSGDQVCGNDNTVPSAGQTFSIAVDTNVCPPEQSGGGNTTYTVRITYHDSVYGTDGDFSYALDGPPPS